MCQYFSIIWGTSIFEMWVNRETTSKDTMVYPSGTSISTKEYIEVKEFFKLSTKFGKKDIWLLCTYLICKRGDDATYNGFCTLCSFVDVSQAIVSVVWNYVWSYVFISVCIYCMIWTFVLLTIWSSCLCHYGF